jgi:hypothetical protein
MDIGKMWNGLGRNGKIALVAGVAIVTFLWWHRQQAKKAEANAPAQGSTGDTNSCADPNSNSNSNTCYGYNTNMCGSNTCADYNYMSGYDAGIASAGSLYCGMIGSGSIANNGTAGPGTLAGTNSCASGSTSADREWADLLAGYGLANAQNTGAVASLPASITGGGAPATGVAGAATTTHAHTVSITKPSPTAVGGIVVGPSRRKPPAMAGYTIKGIGHGWWENVPAPTEGVPRGYKLYPRRTNRKPNPSAKGLGNGWWAVKG